MSTSTSSASGITATVAVDVWMRPCDSVVGTRWTRCVPPSHLKTEYAPSPLTANTVSLMPPASDLRSAAMVVVHRGIGHLILRLAVLPFDLGDELLDSPAFHCLNLALQTGVEGELDVALERARDRAAVLGLLGCLLERRLVETRHGADYGERGLGDPRSRHEGESRARLQPLRGMTTLRERVRWRHRDAPRVR